MQFYTRKRRSPFINIVSLIDILAILLIFFIVTTNFRKPQPQLQINLPDSKSAMQADREAPFGTVVKILDSLKAAGLRDVPAFTQPDSAK